MKRFFVYTLCILAFTACHVPSEQVDFQLQTSEFPQVPYTGATYNLFFTSSTTSVSASCTLGSPWASIKKDPLQNLFIITIDPNQINRNRSAEFCITAGTIVKTISISQEGAPDAQLQVKGGIEPFSAGGTDQPQTVEISTNQNSWEATSTQPWCQITKLQNGLRISVSEKNESLTARYAVITIVPQGEVDNLDAATQTISVSQLPYPKSTLSLSSPEVFFDANGTGFSQITINTNQDELVAESSQPWCHFSIQGDQLRVFAAATDIYTTRTANVTITAGPQWNMVSKTLKVTQSALPETQDSDLSILPLPENPETFPETGSNLSKAFDITLSEGFQWECTSSETWCKVTVLGNSFRILVDSPNQSITTRNAAISIVYYPKDEKATHSKTRIINIRQNAYPIATVSVDPGLVEFTKEGGDSPKDITINTNQGNVWEASFENAADNLWCEIVKIGSTIRVKPLSPNTSFTPRTANIKIIAGPAWNFAQTTLQVTQLAYPSVNLNLSDNTLEFAYNYSSTHFLGISYDKTTTPVYPWSYTTPDSWCSLSPATNGLNINLTENTTGATRTTSFSITAGPDASLGWEPGFTETKTVTITQTPNYTLSLSYNSSRMTNIPADASGFGKINPIDLLNNLVTITSSPTTSGNPALTSITAESDANWCGPESLINLLTLGSFSLYADDNNSTTSRTAKITVTATWADGHNEKQVINMSQAGQNYHITFAPFGATTNKNAKSGTYQLEMEGTLSVSSNQSWCTVSNVTNSGNNKSFTLNISKNTGWAARIVTITIFKNGSSAGSFSIYQTRFI